MHTVQSVAFLPDGKQALSGSLDDTLRQWDLDEGKELRRFEGRAKVDLSPTGWQQQVFSLVVTSDGRRVLAGVRDWNIHVYDVGSGKETGLLSGHRRYINALAVAPDGRHALSGTSEIVHVIGLPEEYSVRLWDLEDNRQVWSAGAPGGGVRGIAFLPDSRRALLACDDGIVRVWDLRKGQELHRLQGYKGAAWCVACAADGSRAVSGGADQTVRVWRLGP